MQTGRMTEAIQSMQELYLRDRRPWVVAYSGGKDSTALLQLVVLMLENLGANATKSVYVVASDTRVEAPNVSAFLASSLRHIAEFAQTRGFPLHVRLVQPDIKDTFWAKLIGKGYPPPTRWFRWCTSNMKIRPARRAIEEITLKSGSVILLLGTRRAESSDRSKRMEARARTELGLNPHHEIPNALVASPIEHWATEDVWDFLMTHNPAPWGSSHQFLFDLYRQANSGECPVVLDLHTPSCGGSRFGCWTCTVVKEDKSMQGFIQSGASNMQPLADFRDWLKVIRENSSFRSPTTRNGQNKLGPFTAQARQMILDRLLGIEKETGLELISDEEIAQIQAQWRVDFDYSDVAFAIARKHGREVAMNKPIPLPPGEESILEEVAVETDLDPALARELLELTAKLEIDQDQPGAISKADYNRALDRLAEDMASQADEAVQA
jgi:DNA sulfur modification protein DndC